MISQAPFLKEKLASYEKQNLVFTGNHPDPEQDIENNPPEVKTQNSIEETRANDNVYFIFLSICLHLSTFLIMAIEGLNTATPTPALSFEELVKSQQSEPKQKRKRIDTVK